jgi:sugar/nucleoside kinase (ribokinase family)
MPKPTLKIGCAGILVEDTFCGPLPALPPAGQLVALDDMPVKAGGCAANVAIDLAKQGLITDVAGCVGRDGSAGTILARLRAAGVGVSQVLTADSHPTSRTVIVLVAGEDRRYLHVFGANRAFAVSQLSREWLRSLDVFYLGGLFAMPGIDLRELQSLLEFCRQAGVTTVVDVVVPQDFRLGREVRQLLPHIDYFLPNEDEARLITGETTLDAQLRAFRAAGARTVIITRGAAGAVALRGDRRWQCGVYPARGLDSSGSGDAFTAGIITALVRQLELPAMLQYASALGASATRAVGTTDGVFTAAEATAFVGTHELPVTCETF